VEGIENAYKARIEDAIAATRAAVEEGIVPGGGVALLTSAPFVGSLFTLYWSRLSNKRSKMKFFLRVKILARATIFLMVLAINPWIFIAVVFLNALFEQAGSPAYTSEALDVFRKDKSFFYYSLIFFIFGFGCLLAMPLYPIFLVDILHISNSSMGILASLSSLFWMISYIFWGRYIDKRGAINSLIISFMVTPAAFFLMQWFRTHSSLFLNRRLKEVS